MRKSLLLTSLFAIAALTLGSGLALACHHDGASASAASADGACASKGASATTADAAACAAACAAKGASTASADAACASKGASVTTADAAACAAACAAKGATASASGDFFVANYLGLRAAMAKHCNVSMTTAAAQWQEGLNEMLASGKAEEHRAALQSLAMQLDDWPSDAESQEARFSQISEWTASYCEMFPEKTAGATVVTCPTSGHRWVEMASADAEDTQG